MKYNEIIDLTENEVMRKVFQEYAITKAAMNALTYNLKYLEALPIRRAFKKSIKKTIRKIKKFTKAIKQRKKNKQK